MIRFRSDPPDTRYGLALGMLLAVAVAITPAPTWAQTCPSGALNSQKSAELFVYFPTSDDATFPSYGGESTSPVTAFDITSYDAALSTSDVRQRTLELVRAGYCEFDIDVRLATGVPSPSEPRWNIVGIGNDSSLGGLVGKAQSVDTGDSDPQDYARIWMDNLQSYTGAELEVANSTQERWARAIANLVAHESAHNYGAVHVDSAPRPGEDGAGNHFTADPATGASASTIADTFNHFSDRTYESFGHNIGLNIKTLGNWDFVNPNSSDADRLEITLLSTASSLTIGWSYNGVRSPWTNPTVTKRAGTITFRGTAYNVFDLEFDDPKAWSGGANGIAPPGIEFHVGASFTQSDPVIVYEATLSNGGTDLALKPRIFGYDAGITAGGAFAVTFFNTQDDAGFVEISDVRIQFLPRMLDIEQMVEGGRMIGVDGLEFSAFERQSLRGEEQKNDGIRSRLEKPVSVGKDPFVFPVARLTDRRHLDEIIVQDPECIAALAEEETRGGNGAGFGDPSVRYCPKSGNVLSLFPATYTYVSATLTDPQARYWDPAVSDFVEGPLSTRVFFQIAGVVPDANDNGIDDLVDIRDGTASDENGNGIPDEAETVEPEEEAGIPWWMPVLLLLIFLILVWWLIKRR